MIVVTACYRGHDVIKQAPPGVRAYCFTDEPDDARTKGWVALGHRYNGELSGRYSGKAPKCAPHLFDLDNLDVVWVDGSMQYIGGDLRELLAQVPIGGVGAYAHRFRTDVYQEAEASVAPGFDRYAREPIAEQVAHYARTIGAFDTGLWELGLVVWRGAQYEMGEAWLAEMLAWTSQDQLSFPIVARRCDVTVTTLSPGDVISNPWFKYIDHRGAG